MNEYEKRVFSYINHNLDMGFTEDKIKSKLIDTGYEVVFVDNVFNFVNEKRNKKGFITKLFKGKVKVVNELNKNQKYDAIAKETLDPVIYGNKEIPQPSKEPRGMKEEIHDINEKIDAIVGVKFEKDYKDFRLPNSIKRQLKTVAKKNKVLVILLRRNRTIEPMITDMIDGYICINGVPRNASLDFIFNWKGKVPAIVLPEWDINPIGTSDYYDAVSNGTSSDPVPALIRMLEDEKALVKKGFQMSAKWWIFIALGAIAAGWILFGGAK